VSEKALQRTVCDYLRLTRLLWWRSSAGIRGRKGTASYAYPPGYPDITIVLDGLFVGVELKSAKGRLRPTQEAFRVRLVAAGGLYWVVRDLDELRTLLRKEGYPAP
jgi:hypothetical protein